jgi:hypothetical protein
VCGLVGAFLGMGGGGGGGGTCDFLAEGVGFICEGLCGGGGGCGILPPFLFLLLLLLLLFFFVCLVFLERFFVVCFPIIYNISV